MIKIGNKKFRLKLLTTDKAKKQGLKFVKEKSMPDNSGVALIFNPPKMVSITMKDVKFPLDLIYVVDDTVVGKTTLEVGSADFAFPKKVSAVIEVKKGKASGIKIGDKLEGVKNEPIKPKEGKKKVDTSKLQVLDSDGNVQANIVGAERVISRVHTKQLYNAAKKAHKSKKESDYRVVGRAMIRIVNKQSSQEKQFTKD